VAAKERVNFEAEKNLVEDLDKYVSNDSELSRSSVCRVALREYMERKNKKKNG